MVCTEAYVHKADDGEGGVGYEAMVVTAELVRNLGTAKFIPVMRQASDDKILPKFMGSRFYVDLSNDNEEETDKLLRELHNAPALKKPPLGRSPYAISPSGVEVTPIKVTSVDISEISDIGKIYETGSSIASAGDILEWRRLIRSAREVLNANLAEWRSKYNSGAESDEELIARSIEGVNAFSQLIAISLAGVSSGRTKYSKQLSVLEEILNPRDWNKSGFTSIVNLPSCAGFVYQALHGAMCIYTDQLQLGVDFVRSTLRYSDGERYIQICRSAELMGWPASFGGHSEKAWAALWSIPEQLTWINHIFGDTEEFQTALVAYYIILNINEYCLMLKDNQEQHLGEDMRLDVPLGFLKTPTQIQRRAYRLILEDKENLKWIWESLDVDFERFTQYWDGWIGMCGRWLSRSGGFGFRSEIVHANFPIEFEN